MGSRRNGLVTVGDSAFLRDTLVDLGAEQWILCPEVCLVLSCLVLYGDVKGHDNVQLHCFFFKYDLICFKIMLLTGEKPHLYVPNCKC